jgi:S-adenosylmethionine:tRNA ribosyltransferase-isomerase
MGWTPPRSPRTELPHIVPHRDEPGTHREPARRPPMDTADLDYPLPETAIAQRPVEPRDRARLLVDEGPRRPPAHRTVADLPELLEPGDVIVRNVTRVLPARLRADRPTGGATEVLLLAPVAARVAGAPDRAGLDGDQAWEALVRPSRKVRPGTVLEPGPGLELTVGDDLGDGRRVVQVRAGAGGVLAALDRFGEVPLPPYVHEVLEDPDRYQTVYAERPGSVAAPTAGLHLTPGLLAAVEARGATVADLELVVGLGTFRPIATDRVEDHVMHAERYHVPPATLDACRAAGRVVAIGTTVLRALESAHRSGEAEGSTDLFLREGDRVSTVDVLLTNLHQPRSSLLSLVHAFVGPRWRGLYDEALSAGYRFLSFGDATLLRGERG